MEWYHLLIVVLLWLFGAWLRDITTRKGRPRRVKKGSEDLRLFYSMTIVDKWSAANRSLATA